MNTKAIKIGALSYGIKRWDITYIRPKLYLVVRISSSFFYLVPYTFFNRIRYWLIRKYPQKGETK